MIPCMSHVVSVTEESRSVRTLVLDTAIEAEPGQFLMVWLPGVGERPISIMDPDPLSLTVARVGPFSAALHERKPGDLVGWRGPFGHPFSLKPGRLLFIAGGYGSAPLHFLAKRAAQAACPSCLAIGARTAEDLILVPRFESLHCSIVLATDRGDAGYHGYVTQAIEEHITEFDMVYACGPEAMLYAVAQLCWRHGVPGEVSLERYMKCGFGICGQCAMDDKLVCKDGPVFDVEQLRGSHDFGHFTRNATGRRVPL